MINRDERIDDLMNYINPENIEKAPEGFASRVMTNVRMEPVRLAGKRNFVPYISLAVISVFMVTALLLPDKGLLFPDLFSKINVLSNIHLTVNLPELSRLKVPGIIVYVIAGIVLLSAFDGILRTIILRRKKKLT